MTTEITKLRDIEQRLMTGFNTLCCKLETLIAPTEYNTFEQQYLVGATLTIPADTIHSISYSVVDGNITVDTGDGPENVVTGVTGGMEATTLINREIEIVASTSADRVYITIVKP